MKIDYNLNMHYEASDNFQDIWQHGYTIRFNTESVVDHMKKTCGIDAEIGVRYRFSDENLYNSIKKALSSFTGIFGDDSWPLYQFKFSHATYWKDLYGEDFFEKRYPEIGAEIWNNSKDIVYVN